MAPIQVFSSDHSEIFKNTCFKEYLWTTERFATWANNISNRKWRRHFLSEEDIFYQLDEKNLSLHDVLDHFVFLYFCTACFSWRLPYLIENDSSEALWNSLTNEGLILDQWKNQKLTHLCCPFSTLLGSLS